MNDHPFQAQLNQITAGLLRAQAAAAAYDDETRRSATAASSRLAAAETTRANGTAWAAEQLSAATTAAAEGQTRIPGEVAAVVAAPSPAGLSAMAPARAGLGDARHRAELALKELRDLAGALRLWQLQRSKLLRTTAIALLVLLVVGGLAYGARAMLGRAAEEASATQTVVALTVAVADAQATADAAHIGTITAGMSATPAILAVEIESTPDADDAPSDESGGAADEATATPSPATRTPRPPPTTGPSPTSPSSGTLTCPGALPMRVKVGGRARVINYQINVRSGPGTHFSIERRLDPGRTVDILDGPVCDDGQLWFSIISEEVFPRDGSPSYRAEGWLVEETGGTYYLEPLP